MSAVSERITKSNQNANNRAVKTIGTVRGHFQARHNLEKMRFETERIKTFKTWSKSIPIKQGPLAEAGFYYVGIFDKVKCFSCGGQIQGWKEGDDVRELHERKDPNCNMVKNIDTRNVTIKMWNEMKERYEAGNMGKEQVDGQVVLDMKRTAHLMTSDDYVDAYCGTSFTGVLTHAKCPLLADEFRRLDTFGDWPDDSNLPSSETKWLANAGFFKEGPGDRARCFFCNGGIEFWEKDDEPWSEHAKNFPTCEWLIEMKGKAFVDEVQDVKAREEAEERKSKERSTASTQSSNPQKALLSKAGQSQKDTKVSSSRLVEMMASPTVKVILDTGFDAALVCRILEAKMREGELNFSSSDNFIKALWAAGKQKDATDETPGEYSEQSSSIDTQTQRVADLDITGDQRQEKSQTTQSDSESYVTANSWENNQSSKTASTTASRTGPTTGYPPWTGLERLVCRVCCSQDVSAVFCPCNHEAACFQCARITLNCPECGLPVNTYESTSGFI